MGLYIIVVLLNRFLYKFYNQFIYEIKQSLRDSQDEFYVVEIGDRNFRGLFNQEKLSSIQIYLIPKKK